MSIHVERSSQNKLPSSICARAGAEPPRERQILWCEMLQAVHRPFDALNPCWTLCRDIEFGEGVKSESYIPNTQCHLSPLQNSLRGVVRSFAKPHIVAGCVGRARVARVGPAFGACVQCAVQVFKYGEGASDAQHTLKLAQLSSPRCRTRNKGKRSEKSSAQTVNLVMRTSNLATTTSIAYRRICQELRP